MIRVLKFLYLKPSINNHHYSQAHDRNRTGDLFLTKEVLYRLSYMGAVSTHYAAMSKHPNPPLLLTACCLLERETGFEPATLSLEG
jgi:hypothetical protein